MKPSSFFLNLSFFVTAGVVLYKAGLEFYHIAWGTGEWIGLFSAKWAFLFLGFVVFCVFIQTLVFLVLFRPQKIFPFFERLVAFRDRLRWFTWVLAFVLLIVPAWFLQFTDWGWIVSKPGLRILIWALATLLLGSLLTRKRQTFLSWNGFLAALTLITGSFVFASTLAEVTDYPFSLGWSEGNRLWDYSIMFGRQRYDYPADRDIFVFLDAGRQLIGGIPFLFPGLTIWQERLWLSLVNSVPYLILGWLAFRLPGKDFGYVALAAVWAFTFVKQGPIHPPLLVCAMLVAFAWRRSLWLAIPLVAIAGYLANISRFTWMFAPGMWAGMLELSGATLQNGKLSRHAWIRAITIGLAGLAGGYLIPSYGPMLLAWIRSWFETSSEIPVSGGITPDTIVSSVSDQPLLWYRLFPNATYGYGILIGLLLATFPLVALLVYLSKNRHWHLNLWQKLAILLPLLAFLVVGLIVSTKIGGGGDLHNLDMFLIGLMFTGAIAWRHGGRAWIEQSSSSPLWLRILLVCLIALPGYHSLMVLKPISISGDLTRMMILADIPPGTPLEILPSEQDVQTALEKIQNAVSAEAPKGEILFMDQRQLLTFGYIEGVPLVPDYDKKLLIDKALSEDTQYFEGFYKDLATHRFSLIITNPLHERIQTETDEFGEENNAWVKWVSTPLLCYYEPLETLKKVKVQLLVPRKNASPCDHLLPLSNTP